jgi:hypothetical protein
MGITRKILSASTIGLIDWRSDKERVARSARRTDKGIRKQNKLIERQIQLEQAAQAQAAHAPAPSPVAPQLPPAGWMPDPHQPSMLRWWDGQRWTEHTQQRV